MMMFWPVEMHKGIDEAKKPQERRSRSRKF